MYENNPWLAKQDFFSIFNQSRVATNNSNYSLFEELRLNSNICRYSVFTPFVISEKYLNSLIPNSFIFIIKQDVYEIQTKHN